MFVLDIDGTLCIGKSVFNSAKNLVAAIKETNRDFLVFSNNSSNNADYYSSLLTNAGFEVHNDKIILASHVLADFILTERKGESVYPVSTNEIVSYFQNLGISINDTNPDIVALCFDKTLTYEKIINACSFINNGALFLAANPDIKCPTEDGYIPDCGSISVLISTVTGVDPIFLGKPSKQTLKYILKRTHYQEEEICFVGDRLYTDIAITQSTKAQNILVLTGETTEADINDDTIKPDFIFKSIKELTKLLRIL